MKKEYTIKRNDLYIGEVVSTTLRSIYRYLGDDNYFRTEPEQLHVGNYQTSRSILFTLDKENKAIDLIYKSPHYPVINITDDETLYTELERYPFIIKGAYSLERLLAFFDYCEYLGYTEIKEIKRRFFSGMFARKHCELFGYQKVDKNDFFTYTPMEEDPILPRELFYILDGLGDNTLEYYFNMLQYGIEIKLDAFKPSKREGNIKKLRFF